MSNRFVIVGLAVVAAGCAAAPPKAPPDPALSEIAQSARQIQDAWNVLGAIEKARDPNFPRYLDDYGDQYPEYLSKRMTLKWSGPIEPLLRMLSSEVVYPLDITGLSPPTPIIVFVDAKDERVGDIIRDVGYQAGSRANVRVHVQPTRERIELTYVQ